ncbi:MAG: hypothetical protein WCC04_16595 [Terriglobales bacterium]
MKTSWVLRSAWVSSVLAVLYAMVACAGAPNIKSAKEVTATQLMAHLCGPNGRYSTMLRGVSYVGSDSGFDYIVLTYGDGQLKKYEMFKVKAGDLGLTYHMPVTATPTEWIDTYAHFSVGSCH